MASKVNKPLGAAPLILIGIILFFLGGVVGGAIGAALSVGGIIAFVSGIATAIGNAKKKKQV